MMKSNTDVLNIDTDKLVVLSNSNMDFQVGETRTELENRGIQINERATAPDLRAKLVKTMKGILCLTKS